MTRRIAISRPAINLLPLRSLLLTLDQPNQPTATPQAVTIEWTSAALHVAHVAYDGYKVVRIANKLEKLEKAHGTNKMPGVTGNCPKNDQGTNGALKTLEFPPPPKRTPTSPTTNGLPNGKRASPAKTPGGTDQEPIAVAKRHSLPRMPSASDLRPSRTIDIGTRVTEGHTNFETAYNMLTGIRFCVSRCNAKIDRAIKPADFREQRKVSFDVLGTELTPATKYDFKFKDYAPWAFRHLRNLFNVDQAGYLMSLTEKYMVSELGSPGKSGSFFYFSRDYKYIIKTIHHHEAKTLRRMLPNYYRHVKENPNTLVSQFYGLHRVKTKQGKKFHFVVMNNLFPPHKDIHVTYDLKGSLVGRETNLTGVKRVADITLKDVNWIDDDMHFQFGPLKGDMFKDQLERDVRFLQLNDIMDYSMLVGIHNLTIHNSLNLRHRQLKVFGPPRAVSEALSRSDTIEQSARKADQLRQAVKAERPVPVEQSSSKLPEHQINADAEAKKSLHFYSYQGGIRTTNSKDGPDDDIYYLGIIDCLTRYGFLKKAEHFFKTLGNSEAQISAVEPMQYGRRFLKFMTDAIKPKYSHRARINRIYHWAWYGEEENEPIPDASEEGNTEVPAEVNGRQ